MKRRIPEEVVSEVPDWVLDAHLFRDTMNTLVSVLGTDDKPLTHTALCAQHRRRRDAAEAWCAVRGLSFCMTVLGWRHPCPSELAAGHTHGAGPKYARAMLSGRARR